MVSTEIKPHSSPAGISCGNSFTRREVSSGDFASITFRVSAKTIKELFPCQDWQKVSVEVDRELELYAVRNSQKFVAMGDIAVGHVQHITVQSRYPLGSVRNDLA